MDELAEQYEPFAVGRVARIGADAGCFCPGHEAALHDGWSAGPELRAAALAPEDAVAWWMTFGDLGDLEARDRQLARLREGDDLLVVHARPRLAGERPRQELPMLHEVSVEPPRRERLGFVAIELVDDCGAPVPDEPYVLELPDGRRFRGRLDARGTARVDGISPGMCVVKFPRVHETDVRAM